MTADVAFMVDQSHNLKGKMEAMVQTVVTAQELYAKAALVDRERLAELQDACRLVEAEECLRSAFWTDVRPDGEGVARGAWTAGRSAGQLDKRAVPRSDYAGAGEGELRVGVELRLAGCMFL